MTTRTILLACYGLCLLLLVACSKDYLDKNPLDQVSENNFWNTEADVQLALTGCYSPLSIQNTGGGIYEGFGAFTQYWDGISDDAYPRNGTPFNNIASGQLEATTGGIVNDMYYVNYNAIGYCNYFLANANKAVIDTGRLQQYKAEVHFLRAYYYFQLVKTYGGVVITLEPEGLQYNRTRKKSTAAEVMQLVLNDLDTAIVRLPDEVYSGHAVKATALGFKARVLLFNGRWADAAAKQVIDGGKFRLSDGFYSLFVKPGQNNNPEILFSARYQLPNLYSSLDYQMGWDQWERIQPIQELVDAFECTDGLPITRSPLYNPAHPYLNRDPRLNQTVYIPGNPWKYSANGIFDPAKDGNNRTGFLVKKYLDTTRAPADYSTRSDQDFVLLRYADILLMYAEAKNELSGPDPTVYDAVNAVRARKSTGMPPLPAGLSAMEMQQRIHNERRTELALEGMRYFDLIRWKTAATVLPQILNPGGTPRRFTERNYVFPFPQNEVDSYTALEQNKGY